MELDALKFTVETTALDDAITKVGTLQLAVKKLGSETVAPKVIKADNIVSKDAEERVTKLNNVLERQQDILAFMASGFSKGQASVLAFGKTAGLATDQLKLLGDVLDTQRKLIGGDTFDKSNSALKALQNQYALLKDAARAYNDESSLTQKQLQGLGLDKERLLEKYKIEGKSLSSIKAGLRELNTEYNKAAISVNQQVAANTKLAESSRKTAAGQELANKALAKADEMLAKLQNRTKEMSKESPVSATAANQLYAYEKALRAAGVGADDATARLAVFRAEQQKVSQLSRAEETLRMQHLSRALAPQVTDVTVGLMTGQNPFTVFLQQGGQIRDQIGLSQVAVENLGKVFKDTFVMMGAMVAGMGRAMYAFFLTPVGAAILALSAFAIGMYEAFQVMVDGEEKTLALNKALIMFGNSAGLTVNSLKALSKEAATIDGISVGKSTEAMAALAKAGGLTSDEFVKAAQSAVLLERYAGVSLDKTADAFKALSKEPLKAVEKLNEETGFFSDTIIAQVAELERLGKKEEAGALAKDAYAAATLNAATEIKNSLTGFGKFLDTAGSQWDKFWERVTGKNAKVDFTSKINEIDSKIAEINSSRTVLRPGGLNITLPNPIADREIKNLQDVRNDLVYNRASANAKAEAQQRKTELGQNQMDIEKLTNKHMITVDTKTTEINKAIELYNKSINNALSNPETFKNVASFIEKRDKLIHDIQTGKKGPKKAKEESTESFSINLSNELQQYEKQYGIEIKLQDDFIRQEKARLDNALAAKEITQGEFNARDLAASERGYTDRQALSDKYYSGIIQANEKNISEMVQQYQEWVNQEGGTPKFFEQNEKAVETLRSKIINTNNETSVFLEKIQASAASAKENAFTRYSKQLSTLQGEIKGVTLAYDEYLQSEANLTKQKQAQIALEDKVRFATPEQASAIKAAADETERLTKQVQEYDKQIRASKMSLDASVDIYLEQVSLTGEVTEQTQTLLNKEIERYDLLVKTKGLIESTVSTKVADAASAATTKYQKDQFKNLSDSVAGAIEIGLYEGGDAGSKALRKIVEAELRKPITLFIQAVVGSITGAATGSLTGSSSAGDKLGSLGQAFNGAGLGSFATSQMGQSLGLSGPSIDAAGGLNVSAGNVPTAAGEVFSSLPIGGMLTAYQVGGAKGFAMGAASTAIAGAISGMAGATGALAGATAALGAIPGYGWAAMAALSVLGAGGGYTSASSTGYSNKSFSNTGTASDISTTTTGAGNIVDALYAGYAKKAESLGISKAAARFTFSSNTGREGQNPNFTLQASAGGRDYITQTDNPGLFGSNEIAMTDANMQLQANRAILTALQGSEMPKYLKGAFDSLVVGSMDAAAVNATFEAADALKLFHDQLQLLPFEPLKDLSYTATEALKAFSGGLDKFSANLGLYYDKFYSTQEKTELLTNNTRKAFESLGLVMPEINESTRANFRVMVDKLSAEDLSIAKNAAAYAGVLQLAGALDQLAPSLEESTKASKAATEAANTSVDTAMKVLSKAVATEKTKLQDEYNNSLSNLNTQLTSVTSSIGKLTTLAGSLKSTLDNMRILGSEGDYRVQAQAQITAALAAARSGGVLPLNGELSSALSTVSKPSEQLFGSFEDYARDFYRTANDISDLNDITVKQLSNEDQIRISLEKQIKVLTEGFDAENLRLDGILTKAQEQVDQLLNANTTLVSIELAISRLAAALLDAQKLKFSSVPSSVSAYIASSKGSTVNPVAATPVTSREQDIVKLYSDLLGRQADIGGLKDYSSSTLSLDSIKASIAGSAEAQARALGVDVQNKFNDLVNQQLGYTNTIKSFAVGTNFVPNDMLANIHKGERIIPAADNNLLLQRLSSPQGDNSELKEELKDMKLLLKAALDKIADNTKQSADLLDAVTAGGNAMLTEVA